MTPSDPKKGPPDTGNLAFWVAGIVLGVGFLSRLQGWFTNSWASNPWKLILSGILVAIALAAWAAAVIWNRRCDRNYEEEVVAPDNTSVHLGTDESGRDIHLKQKFRTMHTQVIGTTSAGKTESVILPWAIRDIETGAGLLMIDGKSDRSFLDKLYAYVVKAGRKDDFRLFSFSEANASTPFNPLAGGSVGEVVERVFSSFTFENEYYRNVQYKIFHLITTLLSKTGQTPTFLKVHQLLSQPDRLRKLANDSGDEHLKTMVTALLKESPRDRAEKLSGLDACVSHFATGELAQIFNADTGGISFEEALKNNHICYFQLPSMYFPFLAEATGKLVLQSFQNAVAKRHLGLESKSGFFSCFLDDFQDYIYPGFGALLNKARSANIGVVFSHQAIGDLDKVSPEFRNIVFTNTNVKCVMRTNDPDTAEYFARSFGTTTTEKLTERMKTHLLGDSKTGDGTVRAVEEFTVHPNQIRSLGVGQGFVTIPHMKGVKTLKIYFQRRPDIAPAGMPTPAPMEKKETTPATPIAAQETKQIHDLIEDKDQLNIGGKDNA